MLHLAKMLLCFFVYGCRSSLSRFEPKIQVNPVGLYVIYDKVFEDDGDTEYQDKLIEECKQQIRRVLEPKGYQFVDLNPEIPRKSVYTSVPYVLWYINEGKIAKCAKEFGCHTVFIAQYSYEFNNRFMFTLPEGHLDTAFRFWLVNTDNGWALTEDQYVFTRPYEPCGDDCFEDGIKRSHKDFLWLVTKGMLGNAAEISGI